MARFDNITRRVLAFFAGVHATALEARAKASATAERKAWDQVHRTDHDIRDLEDLRDIQEVHAEQLTQEAAAIHADVAAELNILPFINRN